MKKILNKKIKRYILLPLFIFMIFTVCVHKCYGQSTARVIKVIDGDTIVIKTFENIIYKIRLIGVDTPETKHPRKGVEYYGPEATAFVKKTLYKKLIIFKTSKNLFDRYGRLLAFILMENY